MSQPPDLQAPRSRSMEVELMDDKARDTDNGAIGGLPWVEAVKVSVRSPTPNSLMASMKN